jgi:hypothetical protein
MCVQAFNTMSNITETSYFYYFFELDYIVSLAYNEVMKTRSPIELTFRNNQTSVEDNQRLLLIKLSGLSESSNCLSSSAAIKLITLIARQLAIEKSIGELYKEEPDGQYRARQLIFLDFKFHALFHSLVAVGYQQPVDEHVTE